MDERESLEKELAELLERTLNMENEIYGDV